MGGMFVVAACSTALALPPVNEALRAEAREQIAARWPDGSPTVAPVLQYHLDQLVQRIAGGKLAFEEVSGSVASVFSYADVVEGDARTWAVALPPGHALDTEGVPLPEWSEHLAVSAGYGTLGRRRGPRYAIVLVVVAETAR